MSIGGTTLNFDTTYVPYDICLGTNGAGILVSSLTSGTPNLSYFDTGTLAYGGTCALAGSVVPRATLVADGYAAVTYASGSTVSLVNLNARTKADYTLSNSSYYRAAPQQLAAAYIPGYTYSQGYSTCSAVGNLVSLLYSAGVLTPALLAPSWLYGYYADCIIYNPDSFGFILATNVGAIIEMDASGNMTKCYSAEFPKVRSLQTSLVRRYTGLAYCTGHLAATTTLGELIVFDHDTGAEISRSCAPTSGNSSPVLSCSSGTQTAILASVDMFRQVMEVDFLTSPPQIRGQLMIGPAGAGGTNYINCTYCSGNIGVAGLYGAAGTGGLLVFDIAGQRSLEYISAAGWGSERETIVLDDSASPCTAYFSTTASILPVETGKDLLILSRTGTGVNESMSVVRITS